MPGLRAAPRSSCSAGNWGWWLAAPRHELWICLDRSGASTRTKGDVIGGNMWKLWQLPKNILKWESTWKIVKVYESTLSLFYTFLVGFTNFYRRLHQQPDTDRDVQVTSASRGWHRSPVADLKTARTARTVKGFLWKMWGNLMDINVPRYIYIIRVYLCLCDYVYVFHCWEMYHYQIASLTTEKPHILSITMLNTLTCSLILNDHTLRHDATWSILKQTPTLGIKWINTIGAKLHGEPQMVWSCLRLAWMNHLVWGA